MLNIMVNIQMWPYFNSMRLYNKTNECNHVKAKCYTVLVYPMLTCTFYSPQMKEVKRPLPLY